MNKYYVYIYYDENKIPFYVGQGKNNRVTQHLYKRKSKDKKHLFFYNKLNKIIENNKNFEYKIVKKNLFRQEALLIEQVLIKMIGRRDLGEGTLTNLTNGGEGVLGINIVGERLAIYDENSLTLITTFESITKASRFLGVNESTVRIAESRYDRTGFPIKYYTLRFKDTPQPYFKFKKPPKRYDRYTKAVIAEKNNTILKFNKVKECAAYFKVCRKTIPYRIKNKIIVNGWSVKYDK